MFTLHRVNNFQKVSFVHHVNKTERDSISLTFSRSNLYRAPLFWYIFPPALIS